MGQYNEHGGYNYDEDDDSGDTDEANEWADHTIRCSSSVWVCVCVPTHNNLKMFYEYDEPNFVINYAYAVIYLLGDWWTQTPLEMALVMTHTMLQRQSKKDKGLY